MEALIIIEALERLQALITANVQSPWCPNITQENLGKAYHDLTLALAQCAFQARTGVALSPQ